MGVFHGWAIIAENATLQGTVISHEYFGGDGDWCLHVVPSSGYSGLLENHRHNVNPPRVDDVMKSDPKVAARANEPFIECEIEPPDSVEHALAMKYGLGDPINRNPDRVEGKFF